MRSSEKRLWRRVPGYDSDAEEAEEEAEQCDEASEDVHQEPSHADAFERVVAALGNRWADAPLIAFAPLRKGKDGTVPVPPASKWMGSANGVMPTFRIERVSAPLVRDTLLFNGLRPTGGPGFMIQWSGPRMSAGLYQELHEFQRVNHFPGSTELTQKDKLWEHFHKMSQTFDSAFDFVPESFVLPAQTEEFKQCYENSDNIWIVKPHASSQGKGIYLLRSLGDLPLKDVSVISQYVDKPLLIQGLKFDLRIYVLVTSFDPLRAYVYREGLTRFASAPYSTEDEHLGDAYRHLTNYSINKKAENFTENQKLESDNYGHKWSLSALNRHLECVGVDVDLMWTRIMDLIVKTLLSVQPVISGKVADAKVHPQCCFELYGFDVLVDEDLKPWLLEVNLSPSMQAESPLDKQIKSSLLSDTFNLIGLRRASTRTVTESRLYSQLINMRAGGRRDTLRGKAPNGGDSRRVQASDLLEDLSAVEHLSEREQKMLAYSLEEQQRCHNFIRLYPTRSTVENYAPLARLLSPGEARRARLLAAVLCGASADGHSRPGSAESSTRPGTLSSFTGDSRAASSQDPYSPHSTTRSQRESRSPEDLVDWDRAAREVPASYDCAGAEAAMQVLKVLGTKMKSHLVLMEYLSRVSNVCSGLQQAEWERLAQRGVVSQLKSFRQRLTLFLRTDTRLSRTQAARATVSRGSSAGGGDESAPGAPLAAACRGVLACLASDAWAGGAPSLAAAASGGGVLLLAECLPPAFAHTASGQRAIAALSGLSAADLEWLLQGPQVTSEVRAVLGAAAESPAEEQWREGAEPSASALRQRLRQSRGLPFGPLSSLEDVVPHTVPQRLLPPLRQNMAHPFASSMSMPDLHHNVDPRVWSGSLNSRQSSGRLRRKNSFSQLHVVSALPSVAPALLSRDIEL